jgi:uncharacterized membrane protein (DUF4010 family)
MLDPALSWLWDLFSAAGLGLLIGLEREHARLHPFSMQNGPGACLPAPQAEPAPQDAPPESHAKGARTFALIALYGYAAALGGERFPLLPVLALFALTLLLVALHLRRARPDDPRGEDVTTEVAALVTALIGVLIRQHHHAAVTLGLLTTGVLMAKPWVRGLIPKLRRVELTGTLQLLIAVLVIWPVVPNRSIDLPGLPGVLNPRNVVLFVLLTAGVGYVGYFMTRILGPRRGLGVTGLVGGLTSSTAVTLAMGEYARASPALAGPASVAALLACGVMMARVCALAFVVHPPLGQRLLVPGVVMVCAYLLGCAVLLLRGRRREQGPAADADRPTLVLDNPFELGPALKFGAIYVGVLILSRALHSTLGAQGLYLASALAGLADVDSITLAAARMGREGMEPLTVGITAVLTAVASNTLVKAGMAFTSGGKAYGVQVLAIHGLALGLGGAALAWTWLAAG